MKKSNIVIVLVEPHSPGNIGSTVRAMKNMGYLEIRLVNPVPWRDNDEYRREAERMAWSASDLLATATEYSELSSAVRDVQWVVGTSARPGKYRDEVLLPHVAESLSIRSETNRIAILFGSEKRGLSIRELSLCQELVKIPTSSLYSTLNLSQSVLLVLYTLNCVEPVDELESQAWALHEELEGLWDHAERIFVDIGFLNRQNPFHGLEILRTIFSRAGLTSGEVRALRGILRQMDWASHRGTPPLW